MNGFVIFNGTMVLLDLIMFAKSGSLIYALGASVAAAITGYLYDNPTK
jgi:hypothetical protein